MRQPAFFLGLITTALVLLTPYVANGQLVLAIRTTHATKQPIDFQGVSENPPGMISCTSAVPASSCKIVSHELASLQSFLFMHSVQFIVADKRAFEQEKHRSADIAIAKYVPNSTPMIHSPFDDQIIFQVTKDAAIRCPDRVVISVELFRPLKTLHSEGNTLVLGYSEGIDTDAVSEYGMFILGYIEGCWGRK